MAAVARWEFFKAELLADPAATVDRLTCPDRLIPTYADLIPMPDDAGAWRPSPSVDRESFRLAAQWREAGEPCCAFDPLGPLIAELAGGSTHERAACGAGRVSATDERCRRSPVPGGLATAWLRSVTPTGSARCAWCDRTADPVADLGDPEPPRPRRRAGDVEPDPSGDLFPTEANA